MIRRWSDGKDGALDITVTGPLARSNVAAAAEEAGSALAKAVQRKVQGVAEACQQQGLVFLPIALETLGGFHQVAVEQVKRMVPLLPGTRAAMSGWPPGCCSSVCLLP